MNLYRQTSSSAFFITRLPPLGADLIPPFSLICSLTLPAVRRGKIPVLMRAMDYIVRREYQ